MDTENINESIHGHQVLQMIAASEKNWTLESLVVAIHQKFGTGARFHTCHNTEMTASMLVDFFHRRGKLVEGDHGFTLAQENTCCH